MLLEAARDAGIRHLQISTDEVYGSIEYGLVHRESPLDPSSPYSASKAGGDLIVSAFQHTYDADALRCRSSNNYGPYQHPEKLIPLCILNALAGDPLPVYGDGMQVRNWLFVEDHCAGIDAVLERGEAGEVYNIGGPDEMANIDVVRRILELTGRDESLIEYVTDRPGHDRRYSLASDKVEGLGWSAAVVFDEGIERTVAWYRDNDVVVGADPLGRVPRVLRAPVRPCAGLTVARRLDTELPDIALIEPEVHGDERGFMVETFRADAWRELGADADFVQENHSRSGAGILRGLHFQTEPGQAKLVRCARGRIWDVVVDLRRDSPTYRRWEGHELDDETHRQLFVPVGFAHGFCVLSDDRRRHLQAVELLRPRDRVRDRLGRPRRRRRVAGHDPVLSERDRNAPRLARGRRRPAVVTARMA